MCLVFSSLKQSDFEKKLSEFEVEDYAQAGTVATEEVFLKKGKDALDGYGHSMEPMLRKLGLPTKLDFQKIELLQDVYVCKLGATLNVEQCKILKLLGHKLGTFKTKLLVSRNKNGKIKVTDHGQEHFSR